MQIALKTKVSLFLLACTVFSILDAQVWATPFKDTSDQQKISLYKKRVKFLASMEAGITRNAMRAPFGRFLLIQSGKQCLAIRITEHVMGHMLVAEQREPQPAPFRASRYEWFLQRDGSGNFRKANVLKGVGTLDEGAYETTLIKVGSFPLLKWSSGDWIYFWQEGTMEADRVKSRPELDMKMSMTEWVNIKDVKPDYKRLNWITKAKAQKLFQSYS